MSLSSATAAASATTTSPMHATHNILNPNLNRKWILKRRPVGLFDPKLDAELVEDNNSQQEQQQQEEMHMSLDIKDTEIVVKPKLLSVDAFLRTMLDAEAYHGSLPLGATIPALGYGTVVKAGSKSGHKVGSTVSGMLSASDLAVVDGKQAMRSFKFPFMTMSASLGLMGLTTGMTAYCGVFYVASKGGPRKGETVVVTGAAGAVGSIAVQLCKSTGARVIGIAGGKRKGDYLMNELNCDGVIDYKDTSNRPLDEQIAKMCPDGIDFVYDNVGGTILDALLYNINPNGRVVICGAISQYSGNLNKPSSNKDDDKEGGTSISLSRSRVEGPSNYLKLAEKGAEMKGFNVMQHIVKLPFMMCGMFYLFLRGKVTMTEHIEDGLEQFPYALQKLFTGETIGKTLVRVNTD